MNQKGPSGSKFTSESPLKKRGVQAVEARIVLQITEKPPGVTKKTLENLGKPIGWKVTQILRT